MNKIKCLLVDDEPPAIELLHQYAALSEQLEVVGTSHSAVKAFDMLKEHEVDLIFLDIQMPVLNGISFIKTLKNPPHIILTTAYREYALEGYDLDIVDYLLKPISFDRFFKAVDRYHSRIESNRTQDFKELDRKMKYIYCNVNKTNYRIRLDEILYVESLKDYVKVVTNSDSLVVKGNIGSFLKQLPSQYFIRIHRSYVVALDQIKAYNQSEVSIGKQKLPVGLKFRDQFLKSIKSI